MSTLPSSVKWIQYLLKFRLIMMACLILIVGLVLYYKPQNEFLQGFVEGVIKQSGVTDESFSYTMAFLIGTNLIPALAIIFEYDFLRRKKALGFWICFTLDFIFIAAGRSLPLISLVILVLGLTKGTKEYFSKDKIKESERLNLLDDESIL
ncbi:MAG: hypothetical protein K0R51_324 [Cytophagaceae bacterium]|jgi:hypothetical protein|nr:hypothetical protein [Cytophagaceae bacterium]